MAGLRQHVDPIAYTIPDAAQACGVSETVLKDAINAGEITRRYPNSKPIIEVDELREWVKSLPLKPTKKDKPGASS